MDCVITIEKINNMTKIIEKNLAEIIVIGIFTMCFFSSCGIQFGDYHRWKEVHGGGSCQETGPHYHNGELYTKHESNTITNG